MNLSQDCKDALSSDVFTAVCVVPKNRHHRASAAGHQSVVLHERQLTTGYPNWFPHAGRLLISKDCVLVSGQPFGPIIAHYFVDQTTVK